MAETSAVPASGVDPFCADFFEGPFAAHQELREAGPIVRLPRYGVWAVARYEQVHTILNDWQTFCSGRGVGLTDFAKEKAWRPKSLVLETDPPLHDRTRRVLNRVLSASVMMRLRERFAQEADGLVDELLDRGSFNAILDLAEAYPLTVFPDAMGMQRENRHFLLPYGNMVFNSFGPRNGFFEAAVADAEPVLAWLQRQMQRDAFAPGGFGAAIHAASDAGELTAEEAPIVARSLLTAGVDTTVSGIGAAIYCLARFSDQFARLRADPSLARAAFEEAVRYESPVQTFFRTTTRPVEIGGTRVDEGEKVLMFLGAANRDPRHWERPDEYDITGSGRTSMTSLGGPLGMSDLAAVSINASASCWRGWRANACSLRSLARPDRLKSLARPAGATTTHCARWPACRSACGQFRPTHAVAAINERCR